MSLTEGYLLLRVDSASIERIRAELRKISDRDEISAENGQDKVKIDCMLDIGYKPRSVKANNLMWSLYTIVAEYLNRETRDMVKIKPQELYDRDMSDWAPRHKITCDAESEFYIVQVLETERGHIRGRRITDAGQIELEVWQTSSFWSTKQMADHIDRLLGELEQMGVTRYGDGDLDKVFTDYEEWRRKGD